MAAQPARPAGRQAGLDLAKVDALLVARREARAAKDWARADAIRDEMAALGLTVMDGPDSSVWDFAQRV